MCPMDRSLDLLIVLHVNELSIIAYRCSMLMYADDTVLFYSGKPADPIKKSDTDYDYFNFYYNPNFIDSSA